ncbi:MAG: NapC/NirT family cytochrome c [Bacteroidales bacterium]|nr:NapC/NirT family cytochrome c [Bacteroidales bacterium]
MKFPASYYNPISLIGSIIAGVNIVIILFFLIAMMFFNVGGSYIGLYIYMILPIFLISGLIMIPIGMIRRTRRLKRIGEDGVKKGLKIDLDDKKQRNAMAVFVLGSFVFLLLTAVGSYEAFHFTESNEFCGLLCHTVMEPEYEAYEGSSHARVKCVECHVGAGADWYVKSKLSGMYQVYSVLFKKFPKPIPTPIENLRPAQETCEKCHWPEKFYSYRIQNEKHYLADSANTEWNIQLKMKTGSEHIAMGLVDGIHWHINKDVKIEYIASSSEREFVPWVRYINLATGDSVVYQDIYDTMDPTLLDSLEVREMDCIDCHNRPSHDYLPPQEFTDLLIASGQIPVELPEVKTLAMEVFNNTYADRDTARQVIEKRTLEFYSSNYPQIMEENRKLVDKAIEGFMYGFSKNIFPEMKASWDVYPNHIGHIEYNGCFRCHNGNHMNSDNQVISRDCNLCHTILAQGTKENYKSTSINESLEFIHPVDIDESWKEYACFECHRYLY